METPSETPESAAKAPKLEELLTQRLLGSLGVVDALRGDTPTTPFHVDSVWQRPKKPDVDWNLYI